MSALARLSRRAQFEASSGGASAWADVCALAKPAGVINMGQGFPDFPGHETARTAAEAALSSGQFEQYAPTPGSEKLRASISDLYRQMHPGVPAGRPLDPASEVCVTTSGTEAIYAAVMGLVDPGDEVVFFEPFFPWYLPCIRMAGGVPKPVALPSPSFSLLEAEAALRAAFSPRTKLAIFNSPHKYATPRQPPGCIPTAAQLHANWRPNCRSPTGTVATAPELELLASLCVEHDALCLSDEVYEACVYPTATAAHLRMAVHK